MRVQIAGSASIAGCIVLRKRSLQQCVVQALQHYFTVALQAHANSKAVQSHILAGLAALPLWGYPLLS